MVMEGKGDTAHKELRNAIDEMETNDLSSGHTSGSEYVPSIESSDSDAVHLAPDSTCEVQTPETANKSINEDDTKPLFSMESRSAPDSQECSSDEENDLCMAGPSDVEPADNGNDADADSEAELGLSVPKKRRRNHATSRVPDNDSDSDDKEIDRRAEKNIVSPESPFKNSPQKKKRPWSVEEKKAVWRHLSKYLTLRRVPGKKECDLCLESEPNLKQRSWKDIKNFVYNSIQSKQKKILRQSKY